MQAKKLNEENAYALKPDLPNNRRFINRISHRAAQTPADLTRARAKPEG
jgi:hypothetical protein